MKEIVLTGIISNLLNRRNAWAPYRANLKTKQ